MLTNIQQQQSTAVFEAVSNTIISLLPADAVYLLGARHSACTGNSIFHAGTKERNDRPSFLYLLVVANLNDKAAHEWQDQLEAHCKRIIPCTTFVLYTATFQHWIREGHPFACHVLKTAMCLHRAEGFLCDGDTVPVYLPSMGESILTEGLNMYTEFMAAAELFAIRKQYRLACFMLHQAAELGLNSILKAGTGFHYRTHNIERLIIYTSLVHEELFYRVNGTEKERKLLHKLQQAYSGSRYEETYAVNAVELGEIMELIQLLKGYFLKERRVLGG